MKKINILALVIAVFVLMQFFQIVDVNPESDPSHDFIAMENPPENIAKMLKSACYDCHSHETEFPWYVTVQPVGWWIQSHIRGARMNLNFSEWKDYNDEDKPLGLKECAEEIGDGHMPPKSYKMMHPEAELTEEQKAELVTYFREKSKG